MDGKELLEQGLRRGIPLWRIEEELDWQENCIHSSAAYDCSDGRVATRLVAALPMKMKLSDD